MRATLLAAVWGSCWTISQFSCSRPGPLVVDPTDDGTTVGNRPEPGADHEPLGWAGCRAALATAASEFRRDAPTIYPPYADLMWNDESIGETGASERDELVGFASQRVDPGRSWSFAAMAADDSYAFEVEGMVPKPTPEAWTAHPDFDFAIARRMGGVTLLIVVTTERSAVPVAEHPLVQAFAARFRTALERCAS